MKKALIQMHLAVLLWGFTGVLGKAISLDAPMLVWYRMLFTAVFMAVILYIRKEWVNVKKRDIARLTFVGCLICLHWVAFYASIKLANISVALVCLSTAGIFTSVLDPYVNNSKHDLYEIFLGTLAICGVYVIYRYEVSYGLGVLFGIVAAILSSWFTVLNKKLTTRLPARTMVFYTMLSGWVFITLLLPLLYFYLPHTKFLPNSSSLFSSEILKNDWVWIIILSLCCTVWAQSLALNALKKLTSFTATISVNLEPLYGILLAFLCYNENREIIFIKGTDKINGGFLSGMGLILLSVVLQAVRMITHRSSAGEVVIEKGGID